MRTLRALTLHSLPLETADIARFAAEFVADQGCRTVGIIGGVIARFELLQGPAEPAQLVDLELDFSASAMLAISLALAKFANIALTFSSMLPIQVA